MLSKKKLMLLSVAGMITIGATVGGATYALFTSSASNSNNTATAGTINLTQERDQGDTIPGPMFYTSTSDPTGSFPYDTNKNAPNQPPGGESIGGMAPGDSMFRALNLYNKGTLDAKVTKLKATVNGAGESSGAAYDEFINKLNVLVEVPSTKRVIYNGSLSELLNGWVPISPALTTKAGGGALNVTFTVTLDKTATNEIQGHNFVFDFSFYAEQLRNN